MLIIVMFFMIIFVGILSILYLLIAFRLKSKICKTLLKKIDEYKANNKVVFCYVDDEFGFKNDIFRYIEIDGDNFLIHGKRYNINEIKDIKYKLETFNFKFRDAVYVKISFDVISDIYKIDSMYIRTDYVVSFVLLVYLIKKNTLVVNKEQVKELLNIMSDKSIKL